MSRPEDFLQRPPFADDPDPGRRWVAVWRGPRRAARDFGVVLEAAGLPYACIDAEGQCELWAPASQATLVRREIEQSHAEGGHGEAGMAEAPVRGGATAGAIAYAAVLFAVATAVGRSFLGVDWLDAGAVDASAGRRGEWWRAVTSLTLHLGPEHLLGNLLFGIAAGVLVSRQLGGGIAWLEILVAGTLANLIEVAIAPSSYSAVGASTAVFAALGILSGRAWRARAGTTSRWLPRAAPLAAGVGLLALLGSGKHHVDVLGHALGFLVGVGFGALSALTGLARRAGRGAQVGAGALALALVAVAWAFALHRAGAF